MFDKHYAHVHQLLIEWAHEILNDCVDKITQVNATRYSYVLKIKSNGLIYYLKHVPKQFFIESSISVHLKHKCAVDFVPDIIAKDKTLSCFITQSCGDKTLRQYFGGRFDMALMINAIKKYQLIQRTSTDHINAYLSQNVIDWRFNRFTACYKALLDDKACLRAWELGDDQRASLKEMKPILERLCNQIQELNIPDTLNHSDFHDNNVVINESTKELHIIDWSEVNISHPLLSLSSCLYGLNDRYNFSEEENSILKNIIMDEWNIPMGDRKRILQIINILGQIYYVLCFQDLIHRTGYHFPNWTLRVQTALNVFAQEIKAYDS